MRKVVIVTLLMFVAVSTAISSAATLDEMQGKLLSDKKAFGEILGKIFRFNVATENSSSSTETEANIAVSTGIDSEKVVIGIGVVAAIVAIANSNKGGTATISSADEDLPQGQFPDDPPETPPTPQTFLPLDIGGGMRLPLNFLLCGFTSQINGCGLGISETFGPENNKKISAGIVGNMLAIGVSIRF